MNRFDPASPQFRINRWPFYWLARVSRSYAQDMDIVLKRIGMDVARWRVLMILKERSPASVSELADHAVTLLPTMTKIVARLEKAGMVQTRSRATDARVTEVLLLPLGDEALTAVRAQASRMFAQAFDGIEEREIEALNATMTRIFQNLRHGAD
jgi:DNA-binding MarR family transcriptional regulator